MNNTEFLGERIIRDSHIVNEYRSEIGDTWIELFPYAFCESSQLSVDAAEAVIQVINPRKEGLVLVAMGDASNYRASVPLFKRAVERVIEGDFASNAVLALSEFIRRLPRTHFETWVEDSGKVFPNGFSNLADLAVIAEEMNPIVPITKDSGRNSKDARIAFWDLRNGEVMGIVTISADGKVTCDNEELFMNMIMGLTAEELLSWYSSRSNGYNFQSKLLEDGVTPEPLPLIEGGGYIPTEE